MSRFTTCPGENCRHKVKIVEFEGGSDLVNFCCHPCFQYTWSQMFTAEDEPKTPELLHSEQCLSRQMARVNEPVEVGDFRLATPSQVPGRQGGQEVP